MNVRFDLKIPFLNNSSVVSQANVKIKTAKIASADELKNRTVELGTTISPTLTYTKNLLKNSLAAHSPQTLYQFSQSALDNRVQFYADHDNGGKEVHEAFVDTVTRRVNVGKAQGENADNLNQLIERISQGAEIAYSETRSVLDSLSKLDAGTESYIAQSQSYTRFALNELNSKIGADEELDFLSKDKKSLSLQVTTREGDEVNINIIQSKGSADLTFGNQISVKYEVEGDLSESEHQALSELMNAIGSASDSLLAGNDLTRLMGIEGLDGGQLADFSLSLKGAGQNVDYNYSQNGNKQTLEGSWAQNGVMMADFNLNSKFGGVAGEQELAQYLALLDEAADSTYKNNKNTDEQDQTSGLLKNTLNDFMNLAERMGKSLSKAEKEFEQARELANTLFTQISREKTDRLGLKDEEKARLKEGFNRLADFSANFVAAGGGISTAHYRESGYKVDFSQHTEEMIDNTSEGNKQALKQTRNVFLDSVMAGAAGNNERDHTLTEQYEIKAVMDNSSLNAIKQKRETTEHLQEKLYVGGGVSTFRQTDRESRSENSLYLLDEGYLELSKLAGGESTKKALMAGEHVISQHENNKSYQYNEALFSSKDKGYRDAKVIALSIESQKKLLNEILDKL